MDGQPRPPLLCLLGPTASGKTDLAIELCEAMDCELVSVDSALVYRGLDIGSAKPDYPHHLIDICDPADSYSAARFAADASRVCAEIVARGRTPLLVGGTMLYFRAFLEGLAPMPAAEPQIRSQIEATAREHGWPHVHRELAAVDPEAAARIHPNHSQRLARALEVYRASGRPLSAWQAEGEGAPADAYEVRQFALCPADRAVLHERIARRFGQMMEAGFQDEVRALHGRGDLHPGLPAVRAVGYRQLWHYLDGDCALDEAVERGIAATRQLAKRQLTWLRKWPGLQWVLTNEVGNVVEGGLSDRFPAAVGGRPVDLVLNFLRIDPIYAGANAL